MTTERLVTITAGPAGWAEVRWFPQTESAEQQVCFVRFALGGPPWRIVDLRLPEPTHELLRSLPLRRIEQVANADDITSAYIAEGFSHPEPADVRSHFDEFRKAHRRRGGSSVGVAISGVRASASAAAKPGRFKLTRPAGRRLPDSFYDDVARAYREAAAAGLNPRKTLALDASTPADTVAHWIITARHKGKLRPGESGKVTV